MPDKLPDGTNPENVDVDPPLGWTSKSDLTDVVLYGELMSPPTAKIKAYLAFNKIPFKQVKTMAPAPAPVGTHYRKVPILTAGGRQINDSGIIAKNIIPLLMSDFNPEWDKKITYEFDVTMRAIVTAEDTAPIMGAFMPCGGCMGMMMGGWMAGKFNTMAANAQKAGAPFKVGDEAFLVSILKEFKAGFPAGKKFFGGDQPGHVDIALYGDLAIYIYSGCPFWHRLNKAADLADWLAGMEAIVPLSVIAKALSG